jgi:hypothetical protein
MKHNLIEILGLFLQKLHNLIWYQSLYSHTSYSWLLPPLPFPLLILTPPLMFSLQPLPLYILFITTFKSSSVRIIILYGTPKLSHTLRAMSYMNLSPGNLYVLPNSLTLLLLHLLHRSCSKIQITQPSIIKTK